MADLFSTPETPGRPGGAEAITRGVMRLFDQMGYAPLAEVSLVNHRRVDVMGLNGKGQIAVCEVKSSVADFKSDSKWTEYLDFCDLFYFAVAPDFPHDILPASEGLIVADAFGAARHCHAGFDDDVLRVDGAARMHHESAAVLRPPAAQRHA
ncbi:MAG: MmcB family DNA repair protein, partial [Rhodospirillales bacterium]